VLDASVVPTENGAFIVSVPRSNRRSISCLRPRTLVDVRPSAPAGASVGRLSFIICSLANKVDDLIQVRRERGVDVLCLVETWHDADSVCFRRLRSDEFRVADRPRPRPPSVSSTLSTNHGGVAIVCIPGDRLSVIALGVDPASYELLCARVCRGRDLPTRLAGRHACFL